MAKAALLFVGTDDGLVLFSDPGASGRWLRVGHELHGTRIDAVWPLYDDPQIVLAGGPAGLWRSDDGGASWQQQRPLAVSGFVGERATPQTIVAVTTQGDWHVSNDGGVSWQAGQAQPLAEPGRATLAGQHPVLLAAHGANIERSDDDGATWQATTSEPPLEDSITALSPSRFHIDTAYAGTSSGQLASSSDRGRTWQVLKQGLPGVRAIVATRLA